MLARTAVRGPQLPDVTLQCKFALRLKAALGQACPPTNNQWDFGVIKIDAITDKIHRSSLPQEHG